MCRYGSMEISLGKHNACIQIKKTQLNRYNDKLCYLVEQGLKGKE